MDKPGDVVRFVFETHDRAGEFASEDGGGDAMLPEATPRKGGAAGEFLEIFDDRGDDSELADLADAEIKNRFFNAVHGIIEAVINGIHQPEKAGGEAGVAADDLGNLSGEAVIGVQEVAERGFYAAQGRKAGAVFNTIHDSGVITGPYSRKIGKHVHPLIHRRDGPKSLKVKAQ